MLSVAHLVSHPIQYFAPLYRLLALRNELSLTVLFYRRALNDMHFDAGFDRAIKWDSDLLSGYSSMDISANTSLDICRSSFRAIRNGRFDVVWVHGYAHSAALGAWLAAHRLGIPLLIREEQTLYRHRSLCRRFLKSILLRPYFATSFGLSIGRANHDFFRHYGMPESQIYPARYCVDNSFFTEQASNLAGQRGQLRQQFGITDDSPVILYVGKLSPDKDISTLLHAFSLVSTACPAWLLMVGDGPLRGLVASSSHDRLIATGFLNQSELPLAYAASDLLVLPSVSETWGLVVNEGMNFGLPAVISDRVGCGPDLVRDGWNGFVFRTGASDVLANRLATLIQSASLRHTMGERCRSRIAAYSLETCADEIVKACLAVTARSPYRMESPGREKSSSAKGPVDSRATRER